MDQERAGVSEVRHLNCGKLFWIDVGGYGVGDGGNLSPDAHLSGRATGRKSENQLLPCGGTTPLPGKGEQRHWFPEFVT